MDDEHIKKLAQIQAEKILGLSFQIADAITKKSLMQAGIISDRANDLDSAISEAAIKRAVRDIAWQKGNPESLDD